MISSIMRAIVLVAGLSGLGAGMAYACDCDGPAYHDGWRHDGGYRQDGDRHDGYRQDGERRDGDRDGDGCRGDGCEHRIADGCRDNCVRHEDGCRDHCMRADDGCRDDCVRHDDGCRDHCYRADYGCHDNCYRHDGGCRDGCGRRSENYSCFSGRFDCHFVDDGCCNAGFRERFYDDHYGRTYGGAYGIYGN